MSTRQRYILFGLITALLLQAFIVINFGSILYLTDLAAGRIIGVYLAIAPGRDRFSSTGAKAPQGYTRTYRALPPEFRHSGHLLFYTAPRRVSLREAAERSLRYTHYFKRYQLEEAIADYNGLKGAHLEEGATVYIPHSLPPLIPDLKRTAPPKLIATRGLYYSGSTAGSERIIRLIGKYAPLGINAIVFDAKDVSGIVNYRSDVPAVIEYDTHAKSTIDDLDKLLRALRERNIYVIARIAVFRDHLLVKKNPRVAIRSRKSGAVWNGESAELWCDPTNKETQDYNLALAIELAERGVDEIQLDYIRFPTSGNLADAGYAYSFGRMSKEETINRFLERAHAEMKRRNTRLSIDIFGVVAWEKEKDIRSTGQRIASLARHCDVISPMLYPSHFNDHFDGFTNPGDNPYHFIYNGCRRVMERSGGLPVRPWLQAFRWRASNFGADYIIEQIRAAGDAGAHGWLMWNSSNNYDTVRGALERLRDRAAHEKKESRGEVRRDRSR